MHITLNAPASLHVTIKLPSSKSISNRALIMRKLGGGKTEIHNLSDCDDTLVMVKVLQETSEITDIHAAGTAMRFLTAYFAATDNKTLLTGTDRMRHRPIKILVDALLTLGADIRYQGEVGFPPISIRGHRLEGGNVTVPSNVSSQYISALMMIAPYMTNGLTIRLSGNTVSSTYIRLTSELMKIFGAKVNDDNREIQVLPGQYNLASFDVENDWSASSYWYEILALSESSDDTIILPGLYRNSLQGDSKVAELFRPLGIETIYDNGGIQLHKTRAVVPSYSADLTEQPDLAQTIVVTCAMKGIPFNIKGLQSLRIKETDRLKALRIELDKLGIRIKEHHGDSLSWDGSIKDVQDEIIIDTYDDHRMAMAFAPCAFCHKGLGIRNPQVVSKSYPNYWKDLRQAGFKIKDI